MFKLAERIKSLRVEKEISQDVLAVSVGVTRVSISHYENGAQVPDSKTLIKMAQYFKVSSDYLLGLSDSRRVYNKLKATLATTGLSDGALKILTQIQKDEILPYFRKLPEVISFLLETEGGLQIYKYIWKFLLDEYEKPSRNGVLEVKSGKTHIMELDEEQLAQLFLLNISTGLNDIKKENNLPTMRSLT